MWRASQLLFSDRNSTTLTLISDANLGATSATVPNTHDASLFYWLFDSRASPETDPLVMCVAASPRECAPPLTTRHAPTCRWLTGGPGCSSELALFMENGPMSINPNPQSAADVTRNPWSWNARANLVCCCPPRMSIVRVL